MKRLDIKLLRRSVTIYIAVSMLAIVLITAIVTAYIQNYRQVQKENEYAKQIHYSIEHVINHHFKDYNYFIRLITETTPIVDMIKNKDREALYNFLKPKWELMQEQEEYLKVMQIHLPDGTSFLRMHLPDTFGDELSSVRPMIKEIHASHNTISGYETGKHSNVYRIISPIFDKEKNYIGAMELGLNPNFILKSIREINAFSGMIFIKEDSLKLHSIITSDIVVDGYKFQSKLTPELQRICKSLEIQNNLEDGLNIIVGENRYITHLFTLNDFKNQPKVKIIFFQDISEAGILSSYLILGLLGSIGLLLLILIWFIYRRVGSYQNKVSKIYEQQIKQLNESEHRFELLYDKAPNAYQSLDIDGNILIVNSKWIDDLGYTQEEVIGRNFSDFLSPDFREKFKKNFPKFKDAGGITEIEFDLIRKDGETINISFNGKVVRDDNDKFLQTHCIFTNITEQKIAQRKMELNQAYLQSIFDATPSIMITTNGQEIERANPAMLEFFAYEDLDSFKSKHDCICDFFLGENDCLKAMMDGVTWLDYILARKEKLHRVCMLKDSKRYHFIVKAEQLIADREHHSLVYFTDVTEVREISLLLDNTINSVENLIFVKDKEFKYIECNSSFEEFLDISKEELLGKSDYDLFDKDVADFFRKKDKAMLACGVTKSNYEWVTYPDGSRVYLLTTKSPLRDASGSIIGLVGNSIDLTEQRRLEIELNSSKQQFEQFMEYMPANILIKEGKKIVYANRSATEFFGKESILGKTSEELLPADIANIVNEFGEKAIRDGVHEEILKVLDSQNKEKIYRNMTFAISSEEANKLGIVSIDITNEYKSQHEVSRLKSALDRSPVSIMMTDVNGNMEYVNPNYIKTSGYSIKELLNKNPRTIMFGDISDEIYEEIWEQISVGEIWSCDVKNIAKDGSVFWEESTIIPSFSGSGKVDGYIAFKLEITKKKHLEKELADKEEIMIAQSRHAAMGEMISMIAHQWRQPISVIAMDANNILADIELEMIDEGRLQEGSEDILKQTQELSKTIDDFRNFFRPERIPEEVLVEDVVSEALGVIGKSLENNNIETSLKLGERVKIKTYSRELMQVLINIIKNAKEILVENSVYEKRISISVDEQKHALSITICDNGGGVKEELKDKIFDPYFTTKGEKNGTGLGLYMSRTIVEKHLNGSLSVKNIDDGACFEIKIPHAIDDE